MAHRWNVPSSSITLRAGAGLEACRSAPGIRRPRQRSSAPLQRHEHRVVHGDHPEKRELMATPDAGAASLRLVNGWYVIEVNPAS